MKSTKIKYNMNNLTIVTPPDISIQWNELTTGHLTILWYPWSDMSADDAQATQQPHVRNHQNNLRINVCFTYITSTYQNMKTESELYLKSMKSLHNAWTLMLGINHPMKFHAGRNCDLVWNPCSLEQCCKAFHLTTPKWYELLLFRYMNARKLYLQNLSFCRRCHFVFNMFCFL